MTEAVFSYGTLQLAEVQQALFGRDVAMSADALAGYRLVELAVRDPAAVRLSGIRHHRALVPDPRGAPIDGQLLDLSASELAACDAYEGADYRRVAVTFGSGRTGWVYVRA